LSGLVPWSEGYGRTFRLPPRAEIAPHAGRPSSSTIPHRVRPELSPAAPSPWPTRAARWSRRRRAGAPDFAACASCVAWSGAEALYFFGYALTRYHALPFTLGRGRPLGIWRARYAGRRLTGVKVELPVELHTHSRRQTFYFEEDGLLRRHDYVADVIGPWARGAHLWRDFVTVGGLELATVRQVVVRVGRRATPLVALHAQLALALGRGPASFASEDQNS
jgi:hypothetical protein